MAAYRYPAAVLAALARHGVRPQPSTPPAVARDFVNDLYRFELRQLRDRLRRGEFPRAELAPRVEAVRRRYAVLSLPVARWAERDEGDGC
jgi:hypothetical protein